ncbi:MAG: hypothetical protein GY839_01195 [candidate division Zixibacteria bacterium]|nr:hypothetical protein [candidate division Zixibacteria bacterium]
MAEDEKKTNGQFAKDKSNTRQERIEYLKYAIDCIENRISMIDNRSSILIAAHGILFAVYAGLLKSSINFLNKNNIFDNLKISLNDIDLLKVDLQKYIEDISTIQKKIHSIPDFIYPVFIVITFIILLISVFMLLKTIRPTRFPLAYNVGPIWNDDLKFNFMWPRQGWEEKLGFSIIKKESISKYLEDQLHKYNENIDKLDENNILEGLKDANFVLLSHLRIKMFYYKIGVYSIKILVTVYFSSIILLSILYFIIR